ncbi:MAG: TIGR00725 family protein [Candidatus Omnitrophica bacterium]|nr:TIGR00725 family protein [Candidatus Omnitrophota bacterium]
MKVTISVIGSHDLTHGVEQLAHEIGKFIAEMGAILVCGGLGGVMEASSKGAKEAGGTTIGLLPGKEKKDANPYIDIALPTSIGFARNAMVACSADIIVALPGSHGTNCEICYGLVYKRPVIDLGNWGIDGMIKVENLEEAKNKIKEYIDEIKQARS